jgi:ubiquinone/menaquinone biosynthesis C-methylase UbiE
LRRILERFTAARPVVHLDRREKALMIEAIVAHYRQQPIRGLRVLDIGCGNGDISEHFAQHNEVSAVDVRDQRRPSSVQYAFSLVDGEKLSFLHASFDLVISHHVIEHVSNQGLHLEEIRRVLAPKGICYLATPNRTSPFMRGHVGNHHVLRYAQMLRLFKEHGFQVFEYGPEVVARPAEFHHSVRVTGWVPRVVTRALRFWYPSQMFVLLPHAQPQCVPS